jgi:regulator of sigma E protease
MQLNTVLLISGGWVQALQLLAALSLLILLHEFGHFFFARLFKTRVEKFYLFFDFLFPLPNVLNFSLFKKKVGDTEYGLGWFPLGGYVKISGMVDESMDKDQMALPPEPWEYRSKKPYQRLFIMLGGIIMNVLVAIGIYALIFGIWGEEYLPVENAKYGIMVDSTGESIGLKNGDRIVAVGGQPVKKFGSLAGEFIMREAKTFTVIRDGNTIDIPVPEGSIRKVIKRQPKTLIQPRIPIVVASADDPVIKHKMGFAKGDSLVAVNGQPIMFYDEFAKKKKELFNQQVTITVVRNGQAVDLSGKMPAAGEPIFLRENYTRFFTTKEVKYGAFAAIGKGASYTVDQIVNYWGQLKMIFTSKEIKASESLGGIISFGKIFPSEFDWESFLMLTAFVSIILAVMNLLPIPGLDGGYVIFLLFEMISGRKVSDKVMEKATSVGLILLLGLMLYANGLDIFRLFKP